MSDLPPERRVLSGGREDLVAYHDRVVGSTATRHGPGYEAMIAVVVSKYVALTKAYRTYLSRGGQPGAQNRSRTWAEAEQAYTGALEAATAAFAVLYPHPDGALPVAEVEALVRHRAGPRCTGWHTDGALLHAPADNCAVHGNTPTTTHDED